MTIRWVDCDRPAISRRYDRLAGLIPFFDRVLFVPRGLRRQAADWLELKRGDSVLEIGCGPGNSLCYLRDAVGPFGHVYGVDLSREMLRRARALCDAKHWRNVELIQDDAIAYTPPTALDGVLFSLSYNTMPHHRAVLRKAWSELRPGGRLVIMDARLPSGPAAKLLLPLSVWFMKHTLLGNPLVQPWKELAAVCGSVDIRDRLFGCYYICRGVKPSIAAVSGERADAYRQTAVAAE